MIFRLTPIFGALLLAGCQPSLDSQPRFKELAESPFYSDGAAARTLPSGVVPYQGIKWRPNRKRERLAELERGRGRYAIHCAVCHGLTGEGGLAGERGFKGIPSLNTPEARAETEDSLRRVITVGRGRMYGMGNRIPRDDIRAIAAFVKALQLSQNARLAELPPQDSARILKGNE